jgi:iron complex outermembrane recepter protein
LTPGHTLYTEVYTQNTSSAQAIAPLPFDSRPGQDEIEIPANSFYNPFGVAIPDLRLRLSAIGNRRYEFKTDVKQVTTGVKGTLFNTSWDYDVGFTYGKLQQRSTTSGYLFTPAVAAALGPSFRDAGGVVRCGTPGAVIAGCTPVNFFGPLNDPTQIAALGQVAPNSTNRTDQTLKSFQANFSGDAFELPAGPVSTAIGVEYREESLNFSPDFLALINTTNFTCLIASEACTSPAKGEFDVKEFYGEAFFPIIADAPFIRSFNATLGARYSDYSTFGNTTNWKVGLEWRPVDDLLIRSTVAKVFRAPQIDDLFGGQFASSDSFRDPCNGFRGGAAATTACRGVPTDGSFQQTDTQLSAIKGGNPSLSPEKGRVFTWGAVYDASWLPGFSTTADFWKVYLNDTISTVGTQVILDNCFANGSFCNLFSRGTDGEILRLFDANANVGRTDTQGVDIGFKYRMGETDWGRFNFSLDTTYVDLFDVKNIVLGRVVSSQRLAGSFTNPSAAGLGNYSRWRGLGVVGWNMGPWEAQWTTRYVHGFQVGGGTNGFADAGDPANPATIVSFRRGAQTYHNLQTGYTYEPWGTKFALGVDNAFDKQPPILYQNNTLNGNTDERTFDTVGRYFWLTATVAF